MLDIAPFPLIPIMQGLCISLFGLALGSFCTVLIHRIPKKQSWWRGDKRSLCPNCKQTLQAQDLIPLYSWLKSKGACRFCQKQIPILYPLIELGVAIACLGVYLSLGLSAHSVLVIAAIPFLTAALVIDLRAMILPNQLTLIVAILALLDIVLSVSGSALDLKTAFIQLAFPRIAAGVIFFAFAWMLAMITKWITGRNSLGMGDIKFFFVVGLWLGLAPLSAFAILSGTLGVISALSLRFLSKTAANNGLFPFGPSLILALYILLLFQGSHLM